MYLQCKYLSHEINSVTTMNTRTIDDKQIYATSFKSKGSILLEELSKLWFIGLKTAEQTLKKQLLINEQEQQDSCLRYSKLIKRNCVIISLAVTMELSMLTI